MISYLRARWRHILLHILVWSLFIAYELSFLVISGYKLSSFEDYFFAYLPNALLFYSNVFCLNACFRKSNKLYLYIIILLLELSVYTILHFFLMEANAGWKIPMEKLESKLLIVKSIYRAIYFVGFSVAYWFVLRVVKNTVTINKMQNRHLIQQMRSAELERNLIQAKNAYLTSQINPHLLFNTLNFIYSNLYEVSKKAAESVLLLSDMMRYSLTEVGKDGLVELSLEVEHIDNMIQLNQARFDDRLQIKMYLSGDFAVRIIPLVLLTFIENIFKHGDLRDPEYPARIHISYFHNILEFHSVNKIRKVNISKGDNIGIENSRTRLEVSYPGKYELTTSSTDIEFTTKLTIKFD